MNLDQDDIAENGQLIVFNYLDTGFITAHLEINRRRIQQFAKEHHDSVTMLQQDTPSRKTQADSPYDLKATFSTCDSLWGLGLPGIAISSEFDTVSALPPVVSMQFSRVQAND